jgi:PAS domain S-box-containing protein
MQLKIMLVCLAVQTLVIIMLVVSNRAGRVRQSRAKPYSLESLLTEFSASLTASRPDQLAHAIETGMSKVLEVLGASEICWYEKCEGRPSADRIYSAHKPGVAQCPFSLYQTDIPYCFELLMKGEPLVMEAPEHLPPEAQRDRNFFQKADVRGLILIASDFGTQRKGILGVAYVATELQWSEELMAQLAVFNNLIVASIERKRMYELLQDSEKRFRCLFQNAPIGIALEDFEGNLLFVNPAFCSMLGYSEKELRGLRCDQLSDPTTGFEEIELFRQLRAGSIARYRTEKKFIRRDGKRIWGRVDVALLRDGSEQTPLIIGMLEDITERRFADQELNKTRSELQELASYLIRTQEDERHRISRELHDDIGQRLSLLAVEFDLLAQSLASSGLEDQRARVSQLKAQTDDLTSDVHQLSHQLHSTKLQHLGLRSAVEELSRQINKQHQVAISVTTEGQDSLLPPDAALCLFRVTQEALNNIIRHSRAESASIQLDVTNGIAKLTVRDLGIGFDVSVCEGGLGLVSMRERLRMVGGEFGVESETGKGTIITASIPLTTNLSSKAA